MTPVPSLPKAAFWMTLCVAATLAMAVAGRETTRTLDVFQVMEMRSVIGWFMLLPLVLAAGGFRAMVSKRMPLHVARNAAHYAGQAAWLYALTLIPLGMLVSVEFTTPLWTAVFAAAFLGERLNRFRIASVVLGLIGVVVIVRPSVGSIEPGVLFVLGAAACFGASLVMVKSLTRTDSVIRIIFWMLIVQSVIGLLPALHQWRNPPLDLWPWILLIAFAGTFSHFSMARALAYADATLISPMDFMRVPLSALLGWFLYSERIDIFTAAGAALILAGNLLNLPRRAMRTADAVVAQP